MVAEGRLTSTREVGREIDRYNEEDRLQEWRRANPDLFPAPDEEETERVSRIFEVAHFRALISQKALLRGTPVADPFVIAKAWVAGGTVVTEEGLRDNAARIPNVCDHFGVGCTNLEGMMEHEGWEF